MIKNSFRFFKSHSKKNTFKIFHYTLHVTVVSEIENIISALFPDGDVELDGWLGSGHSWVMGKEPDSVEIVTPESWRNLNAEMIAAFHKKYDHYLSGFDAFFVSYPPAFLLLFEKYKKPIILLNTIRYDTPFCWNNDRKTLALLHEKIDELSAAGLMFVVSPNLADQDYFSAGPHSGRSVMIPTLGEYLKQKWNPVRKEKLVYIGENIVGRKDNCSYRSELGRFEYKDLLEYSASIHIPYEVSTMSLTEQYAASMPIIVPRQDYMREILLSYPQHNASRYWFMNAELQGIYPDYLEMAHGKSSIDWWIARYDFYNHLTEVNYFGSMEELDDLINKPQSELVAPSQDFLDRRRMRILDQWHQIFLKAISVAN